MFLRTYVHCEILKGYWDISHSAVTDGLSFQVIIDGDMVQESGRTEEGDLAKSKQ